MSSDRDLFDDSTMTFGEHLEELRTRLVLALYGAAAGAVIGFLVGGWIIGEIKKPLVKTLNKYEYFEQAAAAGKISEEGGWQWIRRQIGLTFFDEVPSEAEDEDGPPNMEPEPGGLIAPPEPNSVLRVEVPAAEVYGLLRDAAPDAVSGGEPAAETSVTLTLISPFFAEARQAMNARVRPVTLTVQEGFFTYLKVSLIAGLVFASPWIFWQAWQFVAAGLYPHERKYVYRFGPFSLLLFFFGAAFAWFAVIPFALDFFVGFSDRLGLEQNIQIGQWIGFAVVLPCVFGLAFQMPLVMLFAERIGVIEVGDLREKRPIAIMAMAVLSALLTPQDPITLLLMLIPLTLLYELGIFLCVASPKRNDFADARA